MPTRALVLNKNWTAVTTTTVRQALILLCRETAAVICPNSYDVFDLEAWVIRSLEREEALLRKDMVRTPSYPIEIPEIILLTRYGGIPRLEVSFSRRNLYRRDGYACQYCGRNRPPQDLSIDHVIPRSRGGKTSWENCVLACVRCNAKKANKTLKESGFRLRHEPRKPSWSPLLESLPQGLPESWSKFLRASQTRSA